MPRDLLKGDCDSQYRIRLLDKEHVEDSVEDAVLEDVPAGLSVTTV